MPTRSTRFQTIWFGNGARRWRVVMRNSHLTLLARLVSILGHPLLLMPAAGLAAWITLNGADTQALWIVIAAGLAAMVVLGYSYWRVRSGAWAHVDASERGERRGHRRRGRYGLLGGTARVVGLTHPDTQLTRNASNSPVHRAVIPASAGTTTQWSDCSSAPYSGS